MKLSIDGSVLFANGDPMPRVTVRIFDKDAAGKEDDDLTITPGVSDDHGLFHLTYEPIRYLDFHTNSPSNPPDQPQPGTHAEGGMRIPDLSDIYLPYLRFDYTFNTVPYTHTASLGIFQTKYYLPQNPPMEFLPSTEGFKFANSFSGYFLPFSTPAFIGGDKVSKKYGLCGGMCAAAYDFTLAGRPIPETRTAPRQGTRLHRYLFQRQIDSLGGLGQEVVKVARWTSLPDETLAGTLRRTADEFRQIQSKLDQKNLVVLALIYVRASSFIEQSKIIFDNHQVLAYGYQQDASSVYTINIYDPNLPGRDDVVIRAQPVLLGEETTATGLQRVMGLQSTELLAGSHYRNVRGFFYMPYSPVKPPKGV